MGFDRAGNEPLPIGEGRQVLGSLFLRERLEPLEILGFGAGDRGCVGESEGRARGREPHNQKAASNS